VSKIGRPRASLFWTDISQMTGLASVRMRVCGLAGKAVRRECEKFFSLQLPDLMASPISRVALLLSS
jgi:hypothetical protein